MPTTQRPGVTSEALGDFVEFLRKDAEADEQRAIDTRERQILALLGDFGQHLVYRKAATLWEDPRWMPGGIDRVCRQGTSDLAPVAFITCLLTT